MLCLLSQSLCMQMNVGTITAELVQALVAAEPHERDLVLACLTRHEREWFLAELPRAEAELRRRYWKPRKGAYASASWAWRVRPAIK